MRRCSAQRPAVGQRKDAHLHPFGDETSGCQIPEPQTERRDPDHAFEHDAAGSGHIFILAISNARVWTCPPSRNAISESTNTMRATYVTEVCMRGLSCSHMLVKSGSASGSCTSSTVSSARKTSASLR